MHVVCNLCGQNDAQFLYRPRQSPGPVVRCRNCGLVYVDLIEHPERLTSDDHDKTGDLIYAAGTPVYQQLFLSEADVKRKLYAEILDRIESVTGGAGTLLDVGSYLGLFMQTAAARSWQCKGIEPEHDAWQYAVQELGLDVCLGTLDTCEFAPGSFDAVTMLQVLEHVLDPRKTLEDIYGLLRLGGILVVEVPNIDCLTFKILGKRHRHFAKHHFVLFTPKTLSALLNQCGFQVLKVNFPRRMISLRLLSFGLSMWYPSVYKLVAPVLSITPLQNFVLSLNLREVVSICAQRS